MVQRGLDPGPALALMAAATGASTPDETSMVTSVELDASAASKLDAGIFADLPHRGSSDLANMGKATTRALLAGGDMGDIHSRLMHASSDSESATGDQKKNRKNRKHKAKKSHRKKDDTKKRPGQAAKEVQSGMRL
jgi:hypothetical protein